MFFGGPLRNMKSGGTKDEQRNTHGRDEPKDGTRQRHSHSTGSIPQRQRALTDKPERGQLRFPVAYKEKLRPLGGVDRDPAWHRAQDLKTSRFQRDAKLADALFSTQSRQLDHPLAVIGQSVDHVYDRALAQLAGPQSKFTHTSSPRLPVGRTRLSPLKAKQLKCKVGRHGKREALHGNVRNFPARDANDVAHGVERWSPAISGVDARVELDKALPNELAVAADDARRRQQSLPGAH